MMFNKYSTLLNAKTFLLAISAVLIMRLPVLLLHLTLVLFAALIIYAGATGLSNRLRRWRKELSHAELFSVLLLLLIFLGGIFILGDWLGDKAGNYSLAALMTQAATILDQLHATLPTSIANHIPVSIDTLKQSLSQLFKSHEAQLQLAGIHTLRGLGYVIAGVVIGSIAVVQLPYHTPLSHKPLARIIHQQFIELLNGFTDVFFAQVKISILNTTLTALYLAVILPLVGKPLPMSGTLIALTFFAGLIPVVGNLISNTFIAILSLGDSLTVAAMSLIWLIAIHKLEYFLNAHIIGHKIKAAAWELLIAMLVMEAAFGLAGLISAPIIYAQLKKALVKQGWI